MTEDSQRAFVYSHPEFTHNVSWIVDDSHDMPTAIIKFADGCGGVVELTFDDEEDLDNFRYLMKCFIDSGISMFKESEEKETE